MSEIKDKFIELMSDGHMRSITRIGKYIWPWKDEKYYADSVRQLVHQLRHDDHMLIENAWGVGYAIRRKE